VPRIVLTSFGYNDSGGGTIVPRHVSKELARRGWDVTVFHAAVGRIDGPAYAIREWEEDGVRLLLARAERIVRAGEPFPPRTAAITFDDSYGDNLGAARVLAEHGLPATFFVPPAFVGTDHVYEWDRRLPVRLPNLTWDDLEVMAAMGFDIGSHSLTHADMARLGDASERRIAE